jgi:toxin CcdB
MARFEVFRSKSDSLLLLDLQSSFLDDLKTRIVVPLYPASEMTWTFSRLTPRFAIGDQTYVMATQRLAAVELSELGEKIADLSVYADEIIAATDFLFQGY